MNRRILFLDRDGTLIEEPPDQQVDSLDKLQLMPGVVPALLALCDAGFKLVIVTNQDGLGTASLPQDKYESVQRFMVQLFKSQGIEFDAVLVCPHFVADRCHCRKPNIRLALDYVNGQPFDKSQSYMIGDRETDLEFASAMEIQGLSIRLKGAIEATWPWIAQTILGNLRRAHVERKTKETHITIDVDLSREGPTHISTGLGFFDHMLEQIAKHAGFALQLKCVGDLHIDEHHTVEDCALALGSALRVALGDKKGIGRYGFLLAMDEAEAQVALDLSGRPYFLWKGQLPRDRVGDLPTELVPHFFRSLAETLGAALHITVQGENTHHMVESCFKAVGRSLRQAIRIEGSELPSTKGVL